MTTPTVPAAAPTQSVEWICSQIAIDQLAGLPELEGIEVVQASTHTISDNAEIITVGAHIVEVLAPSNAAEKRVLKIDVVVDVTAIIPAGDEQAMDAVWQAIDTAITNPEPSKFNYADQLSYLTITQKTSSRLDVIEDRLIHQRVYEFLVARKG